jgi:hypothetical protein
MSSTVIKNQQFQIVAQGLAPDSKKRLSLGKALADAGVTFNIYVNKLGQIVLDPQKTIPAHEAWIYENKKVLAAVKRGLKASARGKEVSLREGKNGHLKTAKQIGGNKAIQKAAGLWKNRRDLPDFQKLREEWER